ncbi:hypothetical protein [Deinococcus petrolearius]|uniref:Uncharacterized protein n=1 Tax=Deinococcus petrolearius TaxID=1751295 RepID=A0ABW1DKM0_9DEIO
MTDPRQPDQQQGLPDDAGNEMSDRAGYMDDSDSGDMNTPVGGGVPTGASVDGLPEDTLDKDGSGTTFDAGSEIPR